MYSHEITELLDRKNYNIDSKTYINMIRSSPQINHIIYKSFDDYFEMWDEKGLYWKFKVFLE